MTDTRDVVTLYRPVGRAELGLIRDSGWRQFPPRLHWQPIFYPVLTEEYAIMIARDWNTKDPSSGNAGFVTRFRVSKSFLDQYEVHEVGGRALQEYWIPADEMDAFNQAIVGPIEMIHEYHATDQGD